VFDYLTFGVLLFFLHATPDLFRTVWFVESVVSAALIVLVVRTRTPFFQSRPAKPLMVTTILIVTLTVLLPYIPFVRNLFGFKPLPLFFYAALGLVVMLYCNRC
jgi:P-type Mg2+ transporter